jgi:hypothetical protein
LLLSKLMPNDPIDRSDALFIVRAAGRSRAQIESALHRARLPDSAEVREQFAVASVQLLQSL